jgi:hypothetical protein
VELRRALSVEARVLARLAHPALPRDRLGDTHAGADDNPGAIGDA